jgi:hypothetical protein
VKCKRHLLAHIHSCLPKLASHQFVVTKTYFPVFPSHNFTDLSNDALAISRVSGENLTSLINCWCPVIRQTGFFSSSGFHKYKVKSSEPDTNVSGCDAYNVKK